MRPLRANFQRALDWRLMLAALLLWGGLAAIVTELAGGAAREHALSQVDNELHTQSQLRLESLARQVDRRRQQVRLLAKTPPVFGIARATGNQGYDALEQSSLESWQRRLEGIFSAFATTTPDVLQVSLIGVADGGRELARVVQRGSRVQVLSAEQLQRRGDAHYFRETLRLRNNEVFVSAIEREEGADERQSPVLTMRLAAPVIGADGAVFAVVLVELDASRLLAVMRASPGEQPLRVYVSNRDGYFLLHPDSGRGLASESGRNWRWQDEFGAGPMPPERRVQQVLLAPATTAYAVSRQLALNPGTGEDSGLTLTMVMDDAQVASAATTARKTVALALLGGGVLAALLVLALHRQRRALYRRQAALAAIVEGAQDAIIGSTLDGLVSSWNPAAQRLFGYRAEEAIGQPLAELVVPQALAEEDRSLRQRALAGEMLPPLECQRRRRDGSLLPVVLTVAPVATASGIIGLADTVRAPAAQPLPDTPAEDSRAALERLVQARTEQVRRAAGLSRAALAGAGHGVLATDLEGLITLCNPAAERLLGYAAEELVGQHTPLLWLDPRQLAQRAERFARELQQTLAPGFETLIAKTRRNLPNQHRWTLIRKDGSAQVALLTVTALHDEQGAIQGFVVVAVEVPPPQPEPRAAALAVGPGAPRPAGVHARSRELSGLRLLLVEDNPTNRQVAHALLASAGAEVEVACDGEAGVAALASAQTPFDAVLMDIQLPGMDGYAACHEMRRRYASEQLPIIAMTANAMPADRAAALEAGMNEHIGKPFELATLVAVIRGLTGRGPRQAPAPVTGVAEPRPVLDSVTALRRFEGNQAIYRQALAQFIAQLAELPAALEEERARLRARLHNLKGLAATLGADAFAAVAGEAVQLLAGDCTPERWAEQGAALQSAGRDAAGAAGLLLAEVPDEVEARTPGPGMSEDSLHDELLALWQLLATHNMGALFAYDRLSKHYQGAASRPLAQLGEAIERLDFAAAMVQCQALLANREEE